jgi:RND family efflux transporter MFP subunit
MEGQRTPRKPRRLLIWSAALAVVLIGALAVGMAAQSARGPASKPNGKKAEKEGAPAAPVELSTVSRGTISSYLQTTAPLEARNSAVLVAEGRGRVTAIVAEEGMWVREGQELARLDDTEARLKLERAEVAAEMAKREAERGQQLTERGFLSPKEMDDLQLKLRNANVELEQARFDLSRMRVAAPFSGRVVERTVNLGETVIEGKECFHLADSDPLLLKLYFPERDLPRVRVGQDALVALDSHPGREFRGRVALVNPAVDRNSGTFKVTVELPNGDGALRLGAFARVRVKTASYANALLVPRRGVLSEDGESYVFLARGDSVVRRSVTLGAVEEGTAQILGGLAAGDRVVTVGQGGLKPGAKIKPVTL